MGPFINWDQSGKVNILTLASELKDDDDIAFFKNRRHNGHMIFANVLRTIEDNIVIFETRKVRNT